MDQTCYSECRTPRSWQRIKQSMSDQIFQFMPNDDDTHQRDITFWLLGVRSVPVHTQVSSLVSDLHIFNKES